MSTDKKLFHIRIYDAETRLLAGERPRAIAKDWAEAATQDAKLVLELLPPVVAQVAGTAAPPVIYASALLFVQGVRRRLRAEGRLPREGATPGAPASSGDAE